MNNAEREYMQDIIEKVTDLSAELTLSVASKGPTLNDSLITGLVLEAISGIVAINGGDFDGVYGHQISTLLTATAHLQARQVISMSALAALQSGVAN